VLSRSVTVKPSPKAEVAGVRTAAGPRYLRRGLGLVAEREAGRAAAPSESAVVVMAITAIALNFTLSSRTRPASPGPLAPPHGAMTIAERHRAHRKATKP